MIKVKCHRCRTEWEYNGEKEEKVKKYPQYVTCPECRTSVKLESNKLKQKEAKHEK